MSTDKLDPPQATKGDLAHTAAQTAIDVFAGAFGVQLFNLIVNPPLEKRREAWMVSVADEIRRLATERGVKLEELQADPGFIDAVMQASQAALRTSEDEKLEALRNAVLNSALLDRPEDAKRAIFIGWVDRYTTWHLRILRLFADPVGWYEKQGRHPPKYHHAGSLAQLLTDSYPELQGQRDLYDKIAKDLYNDGLMGTEHIHEMLRGSGPLSLFATPIGNEFVHFISLPDASLQKD